MPLAGSKAYLKTDKVSTKPPLGAFFVYINNMKKLLASLAALTMVAAPVQAIDPAQLLSPECHSVYIEYPKEFSKQYYGLVDVLDGKENTPEFETLLRTNLQYGSTLRVRMMDVCPEDLLYYIDNSLAEHTNSKWGRVLLNAYKFYSGVEGKSPAQIYEELTQD